MKPLPTNETARLEGLLSKVAQTLAQSQDRKALILESAPDCIITTDGEGHIVEFNPAAEKAFGYSWEEVLGREMAEVIVPSSNRSALAQLFASGPGGVVNRRVEITAMHSSGKEFPVEIAITAGQIDGKPFFTAFLRDISEQKQAEERQRQSQAQFAAAQRVAHIGSWHWGMASDRVTCSDELFRMFGLPPRQEPLTVGEAMAGVHPEDRAHCQEVFTAALQAGQAFQWEFRAFHQNGRVRRMLASGEVLFDEQNRPIEMLGTVQDITERKEAEEKLRKSEAQLAEAQRVGRVGSWHWDLAANTASWSDEMYRLQGFAPRSFRITYDTFVLGVHPDDQLRCRKVVEQALQDHQPFGYVYRVVHPNGEVRLLHSTGEVLLDDAGQARELLGTVQDITERTRAQEELKQAKETAEAANHELAEINAQLESSIARANQMAVAAEQASRAKSDFLATMSHEIRTPMNGVIGFTGLLLETQLTSEQREHVGIIRHSGETLLALINDILDFSKIEAGKMEVEHRPFDLHNCIQQTLALLNEKAAAKSLRLVCQLDPRLPGKIVGDVTRLRQVLLNLIGNAIKFTGQGDVSLEVKACEPGAKGTETKAERPEAFYLHFAVRDTGIGIPPDKLHRLFKAFSQVDSSMTRQYGGTGLGLAICQRLCEMMGGKIWVESESGQGSVFHFTLLTQAADASSRGTSSTSFRRTTPIPPSGAPHPGLRILLVEDNRVNQKLAMTLLQKRGHTVELAADGLQALTALGESNYDLVLMDICMPEMDGFEATRRIRAGECGPVAQRTNIVAMTANAMEGDREKCLTAGMDDYLSKPINTEPLELVLRSVAEVKQNLPPGRPPEAVPSTPPDDERRSF